MTEYVILIHTEGANWKQVWTVSSSNPKRALKLIDDLEDGKYVAVPKRSWKPFPVKVELTAKVHIG